MTGKTLSIKERFTIGNLKKRIQQLDGTPAHLQQFIYNGDKMADDIEPFSIYYLAPIYLRWKCE